jgi:hypothetical protein
LDARTEIVPVNYCPTSGSEKLVLQMLERFLAGGDADSANPSALNPVLGLMVKII